MALKITKKAQLPVPFYVHYPEFNDSKSGNFIFCLLFSWLLQAFSSQQFSFSLQTHFYLVR